MIFLIIKSNIIKLFFLIFFSFLGIFLVQYFLGAWSSSLQCLLALMVLCSLISPWLLFCHVEISSMGAMAQRLQRMKLTYGLNQRSWLITVAMQRNGSMESTEFLEAPYEELGLKLEA